MATANFNFLELNANDQAGYVSINALIQSIDTLLNTNARLLPDSLATTSGYTLVWSGGALTTSQLGTTGLADAAVTEDKIANNAVTAGKLASTLDLTGKTVNVATASPGDNDTSAASTAFVSTAISTAFSGTGTVGIGGMIDWPYNVTLPAGYLETNGQAVNRSTYSGLFSAIGEGFGQGDGSTTFNVPNILNNYLLSLDLSFEPGNYSIGNTVKSIIEQPDGKVIIGGHFSPAYIERFNSDGTVDTSFNQPSINNHIYDMVIQSDGKIIIVGKFVSVGGVTRNYIARLNTDGTLDTSYNPNITYSTFHYVNSICLQSDGKAIIGGYFTDVAGTTRLNIARFNTDGTLDTSYNPSANAALVKIFLDSNEKLIVSGNSLTSIGGSPGGSVVAIARLNTDGTYDASFTTEIPGVNVWAYGIAEQSDGKIIIGGNFTTINSTTRNYIARVNTDGTLDTSFNAAIDSYVYDVAVMADGRIIVGGGFNYVTDSNGLPRYLYQVALLNNDGSLDTTFNANLFSGVVGGVYKVLVASDNNLFIGGLFEKSGVYTTPCFSKFLTSTIATKTIIKT